MYPAGRDPARRTRRVEYAGDGTRRGRRAAAAPADGVLLPGPRALAGTGEGDPRHRAFRRAAGDRDGGRPFRAIGHAAGPEGCPGRDGRGAAPAPAAPRPRAVDRRPLPRAARRVLPPGPAAGGGAREQGPRAGERGRARGCRPPRPRAACAGRRAAHAGRAGAPDRPRSQLPPRAPPRGGEGGDRPGPRSGRLPRRARGPDRGRRGGAGEARAGGGDRAGCGPPGTSPGGGPSPRSAVPACRPRPPRGGGCGRDRRGALRAQPGGDGRRRGPAGCAHRAAAGRARRHRARGRDADLRDLLLSGVTGSGKTEVYFRAARPPSPSGAGC